MTLSARLSVGWSIGLSVGWFVGLSNFLNGWASFNAMLLSEQLLLLEYLAYMKHKAPRHTCGMDSSKDVVLVLQADAVLFS